MTKQYEDIQAIVKMEITEEDRKSVRNKVRFTLIILVMMLILVVVMLALWVTDSLGLWPVIGLTYFMLAIYYIVKYKIQSKLWSKLTMDCRPDLFLQNYLTILERTKKSRQWEMHLYIIGNALLFAGRKEDAKALLDLFSKYCPDSKGRMCFTILAISVAGMEQNRELLAMHAKNLEQLLAQSKPNARFKTLAQETIKSAKKWELEFGGRFEELQDLIAQERPPVGNLQLVKRNYNLYKIAVGLEKMEEASEYKKVVLEKGGTTFYKIELSGGND